MASRNQRSESVRVKNIEDILPNAPLSKYYICADKYEYDVSRMPGGRSLTVN